jgi:exodeoxyribonuclease-3
MKIIFYNIFEGCVDDNQLGYLIEFIIQESSDILAFSEANHWEGNNFEKLNYFLEQTNYKHYVFSKSNTDFNLVLFSKYPITKSQIITQNIWHSVLKVKIKNINYFILHLNPNSEIDRLKEVEELFSKYVNFDEQNIFMGDFNSISKVDNYNEEELVEELKERNISKFLDDKSRLTFNVHSKLKEFNLIDTFYSFNSTFQHSVPTQINTDTFHFTKLRLDFFYVSKEIENKVLNNIIINTQLTNKISDHYPIKLELKEE